MVLTANSMFVVIVLRINYFAYFFMTKTLFYKKIKDNWVQCGVCEQKCVIKENSFGKCGVRKNIKGDLFALNYNKIVVAHVDPIEKKPFYHFLPGSLAFSIGTAGCNFRCFNCQNADISQLKNHQIEQINETNLNPKKIVQLSKENNCQSVAYTYTEPTIFVELALECMKLTKKNGLKNVWVSNGYMSEKTLKAILPYLDAINVDLKSFKNEFYNKICGAKLKPVLDNLKKIYQAKTHLEITTLIIPEENDTKEELKKIAEFIKRKLSEEVPWHVSAFYPTYKMLDKKPTKKEKVLEAQKIGYSVGLKNVYAGNI